MDNFTIIKRPNVWTVLLYILSLIYQLLNYLILNFKFMLIQDLLSIADKAGFENYASFNEGLQHEILTCTKGKYSGEVVDIYWDYSTGAVQTVDYSTQFKGQSPTFSF